MVKQNITKNVYFECFFACYLQKKKNAKMDTKLSILGKKDTLREKMYNECFIVQKNHKAKNAKTRVNAETHK